MNPNDLLDRIVELESRLQKIEDYVDLSDEDGLPSNDVDSSVTTTKDLVELINAEDMTFGSDKRLSISSGRIRVPSMGIFAVGGEQTENDQITSFLDALHWHHWGNIGAKTLSVVLGKGDRLTAASQAIALLMNALKIDHAVTFQIDLEPVTPSLPNLDKGSSVRLEQLRNRAIASASLPLLAQVIREKVNDPCFQWLLPLTGGQWSGRVDGLEVCRLVDDGHGELRIGRTGRYGGEGKARIQFRTIAGSDAVQFNERNVEQAVALISRLVTDRRSGVLKLLQREHMLEARVLRGAIPLAVGGLQFQPVESQFPALWSEGDNAKFIDLIAKTEDVPVVVELKVPEGGGQGQYFRNAVGQAVLYREFIRRASGLHPWFVERGLDASKCRAAVAFPMKGTVQQRKTALEHVHYLASRFDVDVIPLPDDWDARDR